MIMFISRAAELYTPGQLVPELTDRLARYGGIAKPDYVANRKLNILIFGVVTIQVIDTIPNLIKVRDVVS